MEVIIDGVKYVPAAEVPPITDDRLRNCLRELTAIRYFGISNRTKANVWDAINALSPDLAALDDESAFNLMHPECE